MIFLADMLPGSKHHNCAYLLNVLVCSWESAQVLIRLQSADDNLVQTRQSVHSSPTDTTLVTDTLFVTRKTLYFTDPKLWVWPGGLQDLGITRRRKYVISECEVWTTWSSARLGALKLQEWTMQEWTMTEKSARLGQWRSGFTAAYKMCDVRSPEQYFQKKMEYTGCGFLYACQDKL